MCFMSKNLYNAALYTIKQEFEKTGKWIRYQELDKIIRNNYPDLYRNNSSSQQILMILDRNLKSFFEALKAYERKPEKFQAKPEFPKYKNKKYGRNIFLYTSGNQLRLKDGLIHFPKREGIKPLKTRQNFKSIQQVRFVPKRGYYVIEVVYEIPDIQPLTTEKKYMSIDLGVNNLATCYTGTERSFIINGRPLKSMNQFYNKKLAKLQGQIPKNSKRKSSRKIEKLALKRNNKIKDYMHKASKKIVEICRNQGITDIIIGKNDGWKQEVDLGRKNNQNFVFIPFNNFISQLIYKEFRVGIRVQELNESYTSKCSALDLEEVRYHKKYLGQRGVSKKRQKTQKKPSKIHRGLFRTSYKRLINSDLNGSMNIFRKGTSDELFIRTFPGSIGFVNNPIKIAV